MELYAGAGSSTELYKDVKRATDSFLGVPSQCFQPSKASITVPPKRGGREQYCANVVRCRLMSNFSCREATFMLLGYALSLSMLEAPVR
jgi:hypothetical protein